MAIQIDPDKHLSLEAKKALDNAKNKSQFLRDAVEYYVRRNDTEIKKDLEEIKQLLKQLNVTPAYTEESVIESAITKEKELEEETLKKEIEQLQNEKITTQVEEPEAVQAKSNIDNNNSDNNISDDDKRAIEKMLDASLDNFF